MYKPMTSEQLIKFKPVYEQIKNLCDKHDGLPMMANMKFEAERVLNHLEFYTKWGINLEYGKNLMDSSHQCCSITCLEDTDTHKRQPYLQIMPTCYSAELLFPKIKERLAPDYEETEKDYKAIYYTVERAKEAFQIFNEVFEEVYGIPESIGDRL